MKILVAYYSRTGSTKKVAKEIIKELKVDSEEIKSVKNRKGVKGYLLSGKEAVKKTKAKIKPTKKDTSKYDLVIIGTPIWAWNISSPIRTYLSKNKFKKVAFFATQGSSGAKKSFKVMQKLTKKPVATLTVNALDIIAKNHSKKVKDYVKKIKK